MLHTNIELDLRYVYLIQGNGKGYREYIQGKPRSLVAEMRTAAMFVVMC